MRTTKGTSGSSTRNSVGRARDVPADRRAQLHVRAAVSSRRPIRSRTRRGATRGRRSRCGGLRPQRDA
jgi:hypothetical protein